MNELEREIEKRLGCPHAQLKQARANLESAQKQVEAALKRVSSSLVHRPILLDNAKIGRVAEVNEQHYFVELDDGTAFEVEADGWGYVEVITQLAGKLQVYRTERLCIDLP
jgi:hypothetical protein